MKNRIEDVMQFTIVVCTYNGEKYLKKCLDAILNLNKINEWVDCVYVVDNNSTDRTKQIILNYSQEYSIIKYEFEEQQGLSYARKHATKAVTDWVIYVDDDNILDENWLIELKKVIKNNKNAGVINGAVIAKPIEDLNAEQQAILTVMYRNLACTHIREPRAEDKVGTIPMGAGMCIRTKALKKIEEEGWLTLIGRKEKKLSSGEDTELCQKVFDQGYQYVSCYQMKLYHLIPTNRLEEDYVVRLINGLVEGRIQFLRSQKFGHIKCLLRKMKYQMVWVISRAKIRRGKRTNEEYWDNKVKIYQAEAFLHNI